MAKSTIYVTGHKNPDTDSIISAMAYAYLKQQLGQDALAVRIGPINQETEFVLNYFNEFAPPLASNIKTCVRDIDFDDVVTCSPNTNMMEAINLMNNNHRKVIAIIDEQGMLLGMATISDIVKPTISNDNKQADFIRQTSIESIAAHLQATIINKANLRINNGQVYIVAGSEDTDCQDKIVITSQDSKMQEAAIQNKAAVLIISKGIANTEIVELAKEYNCSILQSSSDIYTISSSIYFASSIELVMQTKLTTFKYDDYVDDVKQTINNSRFRSYPVLDSRNHVIGMLSRYHIFKHTNRNLILVDHNEFSQSIEGCEEANILEVIDHHRVGGIKTASPIYFRNEKVGCCATIITEIFKEKNVEIPQDLAGMLCCAIISDTIGFKSVTCTEKDIQQANYLAMIGELDISTLTPQILKAGARLTNRTCDAIFHNDLKQFIVGKVNVAIAQTNAVNFEAIVGFREEMNKLIADYVRDSGNNIVIMVFSLIDGSGSYLLVQGNEVKKVSTTLNKNGFIVDGFYFLPNVISRKQQIIPMITEAIQEAM